MSYDQHLPNAFPVVVEVPWEKAEEMVELLMTANERTTHGSSFAVTSDVSVIGHRRLWLSRISYERMQRARFL